MTAGVEDAVRRSHCSHNDRDKPDHRCAGTCTISPKGVTLECPLCGDDFVDLHPHDKRAYPRAKAIIEAAGLSWDTLSDCAKGRVVGEIRRTMCPGCGSEAPATKRGHEYYSCHCGAYDWYDGWRTRHLP